MEVELPYFQHQNLPRPAATPVVVTGTVTGVASAAPDVGIVGIVGIVVAIPEVGNILAHVDIC